MRRAPSPLLALLLVAPLLVAPAPAAAEAPAVLAWSYRIAVPEGASGSVHVELAIAGAKDVVTRFSFHVGAPRISNVAGGPSTPLQVVDGVATFEVDEAEERFSYTVRVEEPAHREGETLAHAGPDFALFKAERVQLAYSYEYYEGRAWTNRTTVQLVAPPGWVARAPWAEDPSYGYRLPDGEVLPRGYVVFGALAEDRVFEAAGKRFRYARLGAPAAFEAQMEEYLARATPFYEAVYGPGVGRDILIVNAPDPMFHGGLGGSDSLFLHEDTNLETLAHEYAHVFQRFSSRDQPPRTTIWLTEGDAELQSARSLYAGGFWSARQVQEFLDKARDAATDPALQNAILSEATYGGDAERFAYDKGLLVMDALDATLLDITGGRAGVSDLLRRLNADHGSHDAPLATEEVTNEEIRRVASEIAGADLASFFDAYVDGTAWPARRAFDAAGQLVVEALAVEPAFPVRGATVHVTAVVANRGTGPAAERVELLLDGEPVNASVVDLAPGARATLAFTLPAGDAGEHALAMLRAERAFRTLLPARVALERVELDAKPLVREPSEIRLALRNTGEVAANVTVVALVDGERAATSRAVEVPPLDRAVVPIDVTYLAPGARNVTLRVEAPSGNITFSQEVEAREPSRLPTPILADDDDPDASEGRVETGVAEPRPPGSMPTRIPLPALVALAALALAARLRRAA